MFCHRSNPWGQPAEVAVKPLSSEAAPEGPKTNGRGRALFASPRYGCEYKGALKGRETESFRPCRGSFLHCPVPGVRFAHPRLFVLRPSRAQNQVLKHPRQVARKAGNFEKAKNVRPTKPQMAGRIELNSASPIPKLDCFLFIGYHWPAMEATSSCKMKISCLHWKTLRNG